jgi:hypothetical protein
MTAAPITEDRRGLLSEDHLNPGRTGRRTDATHITRPG